MTFAAQKMERSEAVREYDLRVASRERRWGRVQAASGLVFAGFALVHLVNQWLGALGPEAYDGFQGAARSIYQHPLAEPALVVAPLVAHVVAALRRMRRAGVFGRGGTLRMRLHRVTGYFLLVVVFGHVLAVRGPSLVFDVFPGFAGVSFSFWWMSAWFYPYYTLFGACALYHGINGIWLALHALGRRRTAGAPGGLRGLLVPTLAGTLVLGLALLALGGKLFPIADPTDNDYARMWERIAGVELTTDGASQ